MLKKAIVLSMVVLGFGKAFSQNQAVGVLVGKPFFTDAEKNKKNVSVGANYTYNFHKNWGVEGYYLYAQNNNSASFANTDAAVENYVATQGTGWNLSKWDKIESHNIGAALHYYLWKNDKWSLSANGGFWYTRSDSEALLIKKTEAEPGYGREYVTVGTQNFGYSFGGSIQHNVYKNYFVGFSPRLFRVFSGSNSDKSAVHPNHYSLLLNIGMRF